MRTVIAFFSIALGPFTWAQAELDVPLHFNGPNGSRSVMQLDFPAGPTALVTLGFAAGGQAQWCTVIDQGDIWQLGMTPPLDVYSDGLLVRFTAPTTIPASLHLEVDGHAAVPLQRPDGGELDPGCILAGTICEAVYHGDRFILTGPAVRPCPPGTIAIGDRVCIDQQEGAAQAFYTAVDHCHARGGRLCTWAEYHTACSLLESDLEGLFNNWEWADDTANHTHTMGQVGRHTCLSQRSANASEANHGAVRCCFTRP